MSTNQNQDKTQPDGDRIGEGNPDAARRYNEGVEKTVKEGNVDELGEKAKKALEGSEGTELREAEEKGKHGDVPEHASKRSRAGASSPRMNPKTVTPSRIAGKIENVA